MVVNDDRRPVEAQPQRNTRAVSLRERVVAATASLTQS
jgi:hypothetical protein